MARELKVWAGLRHPHVLALLGYYLDKDYKIAVLISEYVMHGDLKDYIEREKPVWDKRLFLVSSFGMMVLNVTGNDFRRSATLQTGLRICTAEPHLFVMAI